MELRNGAEPIAQIPLVYVCSTCGAFLTVATPPIDLADLQDETGPAPSCPVCSGQVSVRYMDRNEFEGLCHCAACGHVWRHQFPRWIH
jgi:DNA-directed RNA polymerase subunit RPC12/RpoP